MAEAKWSLSLSPSRGGLLWYREYQESLKPGMRFPDLPLEEFDEQRIVQFIEAY